MPRRARLELPNTPLHITQRGTNRAAVFVDNYDRRHYLDLLARFGREHDIAIHAYVLMDNHVHLLASGSQKGAVSSALRRVTQCYVQAFNRRHRRTGTLWEGRFKSCLVDSERYLLHVYRYIELNPVRARMVDQPQAYAWYSIHANLARYHDPVVTPHPVFLALGHDSGNRAVAYSSWLQEVLTVESTAEIRAYLAQERALGDARFQAMAEKTLNRHVALRPRGRPRRAVSVEPRRD